MSLADLQSALGSMVVSQASGQVSLSEPVDPFSSLNLSAEERTWLARLADAPGFKVTCKVQRWWRQTKLQMAVGLTLSALGADRGLKLMSNYLDVTPCTSLFFMTEALGFLEYVTGTSEGEPHIVEVARFERAIMLSRQAAVEKSGWLRTDTVCDPTRLIVPHPAADIVLFAASPELLLGSLLGDQPLPDVQMRKSPVLIAPGLARLWRPATEGEYRLFECCRSGATRQELSALSPGDGEIIQQLLNAGALCEGEP